MKIFKYFFTLNVILALILSGCASMTPLTKAASEGNVSAINQLLKNGANINETTNKGWQATPLIWALYSRKYEAAKLLIENPGWPPKIPHLWPLENPPPTG